MDTSPQLEPWLADLVEASIAPYRGRLSDEDLGFVRAQLAARLHADPELGRLARDARPRAPVDESGKIFRRDVLDGADATAADGREGDTRAAGGRGR